MYTFTGPVGCIRLHWSWSIVYVYIERTLLYTFTSNALYCIRLHWSWSTVIVYIGCPLLYTFTLELV